MQKLTLLLFVLALSTIGHAQKEFVEISYGASYNSMVYYTLADDNEQVAANGDWHIMVTTMGFQDAGIHINEATDFNGENVELWLSPTSDFNETIDAGDLEIQLFNSDSSWTSGAFNTFEDPTNQFDYGWGAYDPASMTVVGTEIFVIRFRNGVYKKFMIESLQLTTYNFKWANLDGSDEETLSIDKQQYRNEDLVMVDLLDKKITPVNAQADLMFTRYITQLPDGNGGILDYNVTGVLHCTDVSSAEVLGKDPMTVVWDDYKDSLETQLDIIGQDWKEFDLPTFTWKVPEDLTYFVKDKVGDIWKIIFIDFEGSSTGNIVFTKERVGSVSTLDELEGWSSWTVFPNPAQDQINLFIEVERNVEGQFSIVNMDGRILDQWTETIGRGQIILQHDVRHLPVGSYRLTLQSEEGGATYPLIIK